MTDKQNKTSTGGGAFIAFLTLAGVFIGGFLNQPSIGMLTGFAAGVAIAILIWLRERKA